MIQFFEPFHWHREVHQHGEENPFYHKTIANLNDIAQKKNFFTLWVGLFWLVLVKGFNGSIHSLILKWWIAYIYTQMAIQSMKDYFLPLRGQFTSKLVKLNIFLILNVSLFNSEYFDISFLSIRQVYLRCSKFC